MSHFQASISDIDASISTSTRRSRDELFDVPLPSFDLDIDASISTSTRRSRDELFDVPLLSFDLDINAPISR
jgi:hypothetical protein